jgi:3-oxoacyl-[acyl-carrier protein] reductase
MKMLNDKVAIITGGAKGIGLAIARKFAQNGANVALADIDEQGVLESAKAIESEFGVKTIAAKVDVSKSEECKVFVDSVFSNLGKIDILINNAGVTKDNLTLRMSEEDWDLVLNINLKSAFLMSKFALKYMSKQRYGKIVNMSSVVGQMGNGGQANYSASKSGLIGLTKSLAKEFSSRNVCVNAVAPGFVKTAMTEKMPQELKDKALSSIPLGRFAEAEDIANAVLFLSGDESSYITGQLIAVNGGLYI